MQMGYNQKNGSITCPHCGVPMVLREQHALKRKFYGCSRWPNCDGTHGAHPDGRPLGIPADRRTKKMRIVAHAAFDAYKDAFGLSRNKMYQLLCRLMNMTRKE